MRLLKESRRHAANQWHDFWLFVEDYPPVTEPPLGIVLTDDGNLRGRYVNGGVSIGFEFMGGGVVEYVILGGGQGTAGTTDLNGAKEIAA